MRDKKPFLKDFSQAALTAAIADELVRFLHSWKAWPGIEIHETEDLFWGLSNVPYGLFNFVARARFAPQDVDRRIEAARAPSKERNLPLWWYVSPTSAPQNLGSKLEEHAFELSGEVQCMAAKLSEVAEQDEKPAALRIVAVDDDRKLHDWATVIWAAFEFPEAAREPYYEMYRSVGYGKESGWQHWVGYLDGEAVGSSSTFLGRQVADLGNVGTLHSHRGQGIGSAMSFFPYLDARRRGYHIGTLMATEMAESMYRRVGFFEEPCKVPLYAIGSG